MRFVTSHFVARALGMFSVAIFMCPPCTIESDQSSGVVDDHGFGDTENVLSKPSLNH